jgi:hypothetical protein
MIKSKKCKVIIEFFSKNNQFCLKIKMWDKDKYKKDKWMKHVKLFENFSQDAAELKKAEEILGATMRAEYYVFDIVDAPKSFEDNVIIYVPKTKTYHIMDKNKEMSDEDIVSLRVGVGSWGDMKGKPYVEEGTMSTTDPHFIFNMIQIGRMSDKGLSEEVEDWFHEEVHSTDDKWEEIVNRAKTEGPSLSKKDAEILGIDFEKHEGAQTGKKYGV